ncbi:MAG: tetratricopeptide repeat protein [Nitrospira sp. SB0675_bin_23]|nr:tetratricopeptide repeat protein [Nitrospira sp. SB0675_bin_23]
MSIIADTLTRLQAERPRRPDHPVAPDFSSPLLPSRALGNRLQALVVVLGCLGIAVYLWGLPFLAAPDEVMPKQDKVRAVQSAKPIPSGIVESIPERREELSLEPTTDKREDSGPTGPASVPGLPPALPDTRNARVRQPVPSPGIQFTAKPPPMPHSHSTSSGQRKNRGSPRLRNATRSEIKLVRAQSFIKQRQYAQAINILEPLFANPPERWEPWFWLGTAQLGAGQLEKARASLVDGLARDATVPQLWVQRALVSQQQCRFGEALDALRQAELLAPELPEVQLNLAYTLEMTGDRLLAGQHYRMFLTLTEGKNPYRATRKKVLDRISRLRKT